MVYLINLINLDSENVFRLPYQITNTSKTCVVTIPKYSELPVLLTTCFLNHWN